MKKYTSAILISILCVIVLSVLVIAENSKVGERNLGDKIGISEYFKMEIIDDGKLSENKMLVGLKIYNYLDKIYVTWDHVYISPEHDIKRVILKAQHYSVQEGTITNVVAGKDHFAFKINISTALFPGRVVQVVGNRKEGMYAYSVQAVGLWWSDILHENVKTEWRSTNKKFVLPYKEVF